jgi:release factor glutamine methyltransferase
MAEPCNLTDPDVAHRAVGNLLAGGSEMLCSSSQSPQLDAELLLAFIADRSRAALRAHPEQTLEPELIARYRQLLARRVRGEPLAYLTGEREFWSLSLAVTPDVLVPRPETELAVERCLALLSETAAAVADLGTGSGAIALALASERRDWRIFATDCSPAALQVARGNAARLKLANVEFVAGRWFEPLQGRAFDLIVSNPPYVAAADPALEQLRYEPAIALSPGVTGLEALTHIAWTAREHLRHGGALVLEHGSTHAADVARVLVSAGYARVRCYADLGGHDRVTEARWP